MDLSCSRAAWGLAITASSLATSLALAQSGGAAPVVVAPNTKSPSLLVACPELANGFSHPSTRITSAQVAAAGTVTNGGAAIDTHCVVQGRMNERVSAVDGQAYAIGFEMRLPRDWNGRLLYQANGGTDGFVARADGGFVGGGPLRNALQKGFAVISTDGGHSAAQNPLFGLDPQARVDYGYAAPRAAAPLAKALVQAAYGRPPVRSYIGGTSNGGRLSMVSAARHADLFDGFLAISPGFQMPKASVAGLLGAQLWHAIAPDKAKLESAFTPPARAVLARAVLARCDALDGVTDGIVEDVSACRNTFDLERDAATCGPTRSDECLSAEQKMVIAKVYAGPRNRAGQPLYSTAPFDPGVTSPIWADWKFVLSINPTRNPVSVGFIFSTPPADRSMLQDTLRFALGFDTETDAPKVFATNATFTESAMSFMAPPDLSRFGALKSSGGKMLVIHGNADPVFSVDDTTAWFDSLTKTHGDATGTFVRLFRVPGMSHSRGGPSTDHFDALDALVAWVEDGVVPQRIIAMARGPGHAGGANPEVPAGWSAGRTRPLCPYPAVARYVGGDVERAESFACRP